MMELKCLNSNSNGNCFILKDNDGEMLLLDAGVTIKQIKIGCDFNIRNIKGAIITHAHADHSKAKDDLKNMGIQVFAPYTRKDNASKVKTRCGKFEVLAFALTDNDGNPTHTNGDGTPCNVYGFYITHDDMPDWNLVYITDTRYCLYSFDNVANIIVGTNYCIERLSDKSENRIYHVLTGHMSIDTVCSLLHKNNPSGVVILSHLSLENADADVFKERAEEIVNCPVHIGTAGLTIQI